MRYLLFLSLFVLILGCAQPEQTPQQETLPAAPAEEPPATEEPEAPVEEPGEPSAPPEEPVEPTPEETTSLESEEIVYSSYGWDIHGTLYPAVNKKNPTKGIILVHMLGKDRSSYPISFIERLHNEVPEAVIMNIDARGHGESTNLGTYDEFIDEDWRAMASDVVHAKKYFKTNYPTADEYYVVGASIGSTAAIHAGRQENDIIKVAMLSPGMEYQGVSIERAAEDYTHKLFLAACSGDTYSADSAEQVESLSPSQVTLKIYQGSEHGTDMLGTTNLENDLIAFLK